jgi:hypothetical protein
MNNTHEQEKKYWQERGELNLEREKKSWQSKESALKEEIDLLERKLVDAQLSTKVSK